MRFIALAHRWLGVFGSLLFVTWFASGIVMMYARMPEIAPRERLDRAGVLRLDAATVTPLDAATRAGVAPQAVTVGMLLGRPVYRFVDRAETVVVFADTGDLFRGFTREEAMQEADRIYPTPLPSIPAYDTRIVEPDQWTLQARSQLPMHRIDLRDPAGTVLYLSDTTGQLAVRTTARERRLAYAGAVLHWLYFTPLRKHGPLWNQTIIWLSIAGCVMCLLGLIWGLSVGWRSPYRGWMQWHHYTGLVFGAVTFTWIFSGLLSMDPWNWHPSTAPTRGQRDAFSGGPLRLAAISLDAVRRSAANGAHEIEIAQFRGAPRLIANDSAASPIDREQIMQAARDAMPGSSVADATLMNAYDSYYYARSDALPLPVWRVRFADRVGTWLYVDPIRGAVVRKEERLSRLNRWLYHGLHSFDFPGLYNRRPLWDAVVIILSLGGIGSAITSIVPACRRLRRHAHRLYTYRDPGRESDALSRP